MHAAPWQALRRLRPRPTHVRSPLAPCTPPPPQHARTLLKGWSGRIALFRHWRSVFVSSKGNPDRDSKVGRGQG